MILRLLSVFVALTLLTLTSTVRSSNSRYHHPNKRKKPHQKTISEMYNVPTGFVYVSTTASTTAAITMRIGNRTINTNLQTALADISPVVVDSNPKPVVANNSSSNVIFEVLGIDPYSKEHRKFSMRFILLTSLYGTLGLSCILATYCLLRMISGRQKRNRQYMLLTKRDLDFPLGGGGI